MRTAILPWALAISILLAGCGGSSPSQPGAATVIATSSPLPPATPTIAIPPDNRIRIPKIGVDASLTSSVIARDPSKVEREDHQKLGDPDGPDDVALYDFAGWSTYGGAPGLGNAVAYGRLDSGRVACKNGTLPPPCEAVFWNLIRLQPSDHVFIFWTQQAFDYVVVSRCIVGVTDFEKSGVLARTKAEALTLLTPSGAFVNGSYSDFLIIRAERVPGSVGNECPSGTRPAPPPPPSATSPVPVIAPSSAPSASPIALGLRYERQLAVGSVQIPAAAPIPPDAIPHQFAIAGIESIPAPQDMFNYLTVAPALPGRPGGKPSGVIRQQGGFIAIFVPANTPAGAYTLTIALPDGRRSSVSFQHNAP